MKRAKILLILIIITSMVCGCFKRDDLEDVEIYTTVYPIEYLTKQLYGYNSDVKSIYPADADLSKYKVTNKQKETYAEGALFVYNGLGDEKEIARDLLNKNRNLKIIDVSQGMEYDKGMSELWLNPSDFLMLANNLKTGLEEYIQNKVIITEIEENYNKLKVLISSFDAELEMSKTTAEDSNILVASDELMFLNKYGFDVTNIDSSDYEVQSTTESKAKKLVSNGTVKYIYMLDNEKESDLVKELVSDGAKVIRLSSMTLLTEEEREDNSTYETIMRENIDNLKKEMFEN